MYGRMDEYVTYYMDEINLIQFNLIQPSIIHYIIVTVRPLYISTNHDDGLFMITTCLEGTDMHMHINIHVHGNYVG